MLKPVVEQLLKLEFVGSVTAFDLLHVVIAEAVLVIDHDYSTAACCAPPDRLFDSYFMISDEAYVVTHESCL